MKNQVKKQITVNTVALVNVQTDNETLQEQVQRLTRLAGKYRKALRVAGTHLAESIVTSCKGKQSIRHSRHYPAFRAIVNVLKD